jgi:hypothetical protein
VPRRDPATWADAAPRGVNLYVRYGTVSIDVFSRDDSDDENLAEATAVAEVLMGKI